MGFLFREKIETVLQETLFNPQSLLEQSVADTMSQVLVIRDDVLGRVKKIRAGGEGEGRPATTHKQQHLEQAYPTEARERGNTKRKDGYAATKTENR